MKNILFVGGGTLGHIFPSFAVAEHLPKTHEPLFIIGTKKAEIDVMTQSGYRFFSLDVPPFPRECSLSLFLFPLQFLRACVRACSLLRSTKISIVFSKGGYVSVPVCCAAFLLNIPIIWHASDSVLSRSDRLFQRVSRVFCTGFPPHALGIPSSCSVRYTGNPVRSSLCSGSKDEALRITGLSAEKPTILVLGGSQGALSINLALQEMLPLFVSSVQIIHLTGEGKHITFSHPSYYASPFSSDALPHFYALADIIVSRAGAGSISEVATLSKPLILIPLEGIADDHQVHNAEVLRDAGAARLLPQKRIAELPTILQGLVEDLSQQRTLGNTLHTFFPSESARHISSILLDEALLTSVE